MARYGDQHSARIALYTLDYGVMIQHYDARDWVAFRAEVAKAAKSLAGAGAEVLVICSNTTHVGAEVAAQASGLPVIHLLDVLTKALNAAGSERPLLIGTPVVMEAGQYRDGLATRYDGDVILPSPIDQQTIGRIILDELVRGVVTDASRRQLVAIIEASGADGVILGCTELCMILSQEHTSIPVFDTTALHAGAASKFAFGEG